MPRFLFSKHRIFLFYWALMIALGGYLAYDYCTDYYEEMEPVLANTVKKGRGFAGLLNEVKMSDIDRYADAYPFSAIQQLRRKAKVAQKQVDHCAEIIEKIKTQRRIKTAVDLAPLAAVYHQLGDSLLLFSDRDSAIAMKLQALVFQPAADLKTLKMGLFFKTASPMQVDLYLKDLEWKMNLALGLTLAHLDQTIHQDEIKFDSTYVLLSTGLCAQAGQTFSGYIFLQDYAPGADNKVQCSINGRNYPLRNGLVEFDSVFQRPGYYEQQVDFYTIDPFTGNKKIYSKTFGFNILKP